MFNKMLVLLLALASINADTVNYSDCGSKLGTVADVRILGCTTDMPRCILKRGTNATVEIEFTAGSSTDALKIDVHGVILDVPVPFNMPNENACKDSGIDCPVVANKKYVYTATLPIIKKYPRVTVDIKMELRNDGDDFACVLIPSKLQ